jgi:hypothetical protein
VKAPAPDLDEEEHVERAQGRGLDGKEVARPDPLCLSTQELAPARAVPAGCGLEPRGPKDLLHRGRSHAHPELSALPLDPHVPPSWVLPCHAADERRECRVDGRAAEALLLERPFPPHEFSVPTQQGGGRHDEGPQRCLGSTREQAARKALSIRRSFGRPTLRESTFTWCRRTTTSISSSRSALE